MGLRARGASLIVLAAMSSMAATAAVIARQPSQQPRTIAQRFLDAYARDAVIEIPNADLPALVLDLQRAGRAWVGEDPANLQRRKYIAALAPLDLADRAPSDKRPELIEWACDLLRSGAPDDFERQWMLAAFRLFAQRGDLKSADYARATRTHLEHSVALFPADQRLKLSRILARNESQAVANASKVADSRLVGYQWAGMWGPIRGRVDIRPTMTDLQALSDDPLVGAEATIHLGVIEFLRGQVDAGLAHLQAAVARTDDPYLLNFDWLMQGLTQASRGDAALALAAYRTAFETLPTMSAATALSVELFRSGARDEASTIMETAYRSPSGWLDPWHDSVNWRGRFADDLGRLRAMAGLPARPVIVAARDNPANHLSAMPAVDPTRVASPAAAVPPNGSTAPQFRTTTTSVMVDVAVHDGKVPVNSLTIDDFELFDNGVRQTLDALSMSQVPLDVSMVMDLSDVIGISDRALRWQPLQIFADVVRVTGLLKPTDRIRLLEANPWGPFEFLALQPAAGVAGRSLSWSSYAVPQSSVFDATAAALLARSAAERRSLVLVFTDGFDGASVLTPDQVIGVARESDAVVYLARQYGFEELRNRQSPSADPLLRPISPSAIEQVAVVTGGLVRHPQPNESMVTFFEEVLADFRQRYLFHYAPTGVSETGWHTITVRLKKPGKYTVTARRGYFGG